MNDRQPPRWKRLLRANQDLLSVEVFIGVMLLVNFAAPSLAIWHLALIGFVAYIVVDKAAQTIRAKLDADDVRRRRLHPDHGQRRAR